MSETSTTQVSRSPTFTGRFILPSGAALGAAQCVLDTLRHLFRIQGEPEYIRSDNGPEFIAKAGREWPPPFPLLACLKILRGKG